MEEGASMGLMVISVRSRECETKLRIWSGEELVLLSSGRSSKCVINLSIS